MTLEELLAPVDRILREERVAYAVIGAYAAAAWGEVRATRDLDLLTDLSEIARLHEALDRRGFRAELRTGDADDPIDRVVRIEVPSRGEMQQVDVLAGIRRAPAGIVQRARTVRLSTIDIPVASPEDMVILKLLAGSAHDIEDARGIVRVQGDRLSRHQLVALCPAELQVKLESLLGR